MNAEIIAVGSEMLTPDNLDTNSLYITERLNEAGFQIHFKTVVGDDLDDIGDVLRNALRRSTLVILTGGLGPTEDDLTRRSVASVLDRPLHTDPEVLRIIRERFASRGYSMPAINERQAEVIAGAEVLPNTMGTAPGMWIEENGRCIALLPGPPREAKPMLERSILPRLREMAGGRRLARRAIHIAGLTESEVDSRVAPIYRNYPEIQTTILAGTGLVTLRLHHWLRAGETPSALEELASAISASLGDAVFSSKDESIEEVVGTMLLGSGRTLSVAESCTSGLLAARLTRVPGSSRYFSGGVLCYSNEVKTNLCGVPLDLLLRHGAVSGEVAEALASGVRTATGSSVGLSITGIAGPGGGTPEKPVGLVFVGISEAGRSTHARRIIPGDRESVRERAAFLALALLRKFLLAPATAGSTPLNNGTVPHAPGQTHGA
jgi:nicotinamide-nucleotide amidase